MVGEITFSCYDEKILPWKGDFGELREVVSILLLFMLNLYRIVMMTLRLTLHWLKTLKPTWSQTWRSKLTSIFDRSRNMGMRRGSFAISERKPSALWSPWIRRRQSTSKMMSFSTRNRMGTDKRKMKRRAQMRSLRLLRMCSLRCLRFPYNFSSRCINISNK